MAQSKILVSIVIPVYNTKFQFLEDCFFSVNNQTHSNVELVIIDDGSKEECANAIDSIVSRLNNVSCKVFHEKNSGASASRNKGIDRSTGEFVCIVDSDDILHPQYVEYLLKACIETSSDFAICRHKVVKEEKQIDKNDLEFIVNLYSPKDTWKNADTGYIWNKMYRKSLLKNIYFNEDLSAGSGEDVEFMNLVMERIRGCAVVPLKLYFYRVNGYNITSNLKACSYLSCRNAFLKRLSIGCIRENSELREIVWESVISQDIKYMVALCDEKKENWKSKVYEEQLLYRVSYMPNITNGNNIIIKFTNIAACLPNFLFVLYLKNLSTLRKINNEKKRRKWEVT